MNISYNFISLVAIGNFNPAIVSSDFLNKVCELNLGEPTDQSPSAIPVHRYLQFQNLRFILDMDRLQIIETGIADISETKILGIFDAYYKKLPYTPLKAVGVNINCNLLAEIGAKTDFLLKKISDPCAYLDFFDINEINVTVSSSQTKTDKTWISSNYRIENVHGLTRLINVMQKKDSFNLNYNYEAGKLDQHKSDLRLLLNGYKKFCDEFLSFAKYLEG